MRFTFINKTGYKISVRGTNDITSDDLVLNDDAVVYNCSGDEHSILVLKKFVMIILIPYDNDYSMPIKAAALPTSKTKTDIFAEIGVNEDNNEIRLIDCDVENVPSLPSIVRKEDKRIKISTHETNLIIGLGEYVIRADNSIDVRKNDIFYEVVADNGIHVENIVNIYNFMDASQIDDPSNVYSFILVVILILILTIVLVFIIYRAKVNSN